jgi:hypothetical protein
MDTGELSQMSSLNVTAEPDLIGPPLIQGIDPETIGIIAGSILGALLLGGGLAGTIVYFRRRRREGAKPESDDDVPMEPPSSAPSAPSRTSEYAAFSAPAPYDDVHVVRANHDE